MPSPLALPLCCEAPAAHPPVTPPHGEGSPCRHRTRGNRTACGGACPLALPLSGEAPTAHPPVTPPHGEGPPYRHQTRGNRTARGGACPPHARAMAVSVRTPGHAA